MSTKHVPVQVTKSVVLRSMKFNRVEFVRVQELCESRGGRPGLPVPANSHGLRGRKATLEEEGALS